MTSRELFREAIEKVKSLQGTAEAKADLFEAEASRLEKLTKGSWSAHRLVGTNGEHVFVGRLGQLLVIDSLANLFTGHISNAVQQFISPNMVNLDYSKLKPRI